MNPQLENAMSYIRAATLGTIGGLVWMAAALAGQPVAIVEDVSGKMSGVEFMDYVETGKVIKLGPHDQMVLDYLKSCWRETITGGTVTVGNEQSQVQLGSVKRVRVKCDGGRMELSPEQSVESAGLISRSMGEQPGGGRKTSPQVTLYACIPIIDVKVGNTLLVERIDKPGERMELSIQPAQLVRGEFYDFASTNRVLTAGGVYRATLGTKQIVFKIDDAAPPMAPLASRLLRF
jgi:hypothetical protein